MILKSPIEKRLEKLKQKLATLKKEEVKIIVTHEIVCRIISNSIKPMLRRLLEKLHEFNKDFISNSFYWFGGGKRIQTIDELEQVCADKDFLSNNRDMYFSYRLHGLKMGGTEAFDTGLQLHFVIDEYWYGFRLVNYNNQQAFLKKLYDQDLTKDDIENIVDTVCEYLIEDIDRRLEYLVE